MENKGEHTKGHIDRLIKTLERNIDLENVNVMSLSRAYSKGYKKGMQDMLDKLNEKYK